MKGFGLVFVGLIFQCDEINQKRIMGAAFKLDSADRCDIFGQFSRENYSESDLLMD